MRANRPPFLAAATLSAVTAIVVRPWLRLDQHWRDLADASHHLIRIYAVDAALARGELYPRWMSDLYLGYGYPLLNFYGPATYYLGSALHRLGFTIYASLQWTGVIATAMGVVGAFALAWELYRRFLPGVIAGSVFGLSPYPFLTNLYIRATLPEVLALGALPWLLWLATKSCRRGGAWPIALALSVGAFALVHNISTMLGVGLTIAWIPIVSSPQSTRVTWRNAALAATAVALGLGLASFFLVPALRETPYIQLELLGGTFHNPTSWTFDPLRAARKTDLPDYPHTPVGPADLHITYDYSALGKWAPVKPSLGQLALWVTSLATLGGVLLAMPRQRGASVAAFTAWGLAAAAACWFMNTSWSHFVWEAVPILRTVEFPWRLYGQLALALGIAAAGALSLVMTGAIARPAAIVSIALVALLGYGSLVARPFLNGPTPDHDVDASTLAREEFDRYGAGTTTLGEYLPKTVGWDEDKDWGTRRGIRVYERAYPQASWQAGLVRVLDGRASVASAAGRDGLIQVQVSAETATTLALHQIAFPGWRAFVDRVPVPIDVSARDPDVDARLGLITVAVPSGDHTVTVRYGPTPAREAGAVVSGISLGAVLAWVAALASRLRRMRTGFVFALLAPLFGGVGALALTLAQRGPPPQEVPPAVSTVFDVASAVVAGDARLFAPLQPAPTRTGEYLDLRFLRIGRDERRWLYMHPPSQVSVQLVVPAHAFLQTGLALDPASWGRELGDGVRFIVEADAAGSRRVLLDRHVNPRARAEERRWLDEWVDLSGVAGQVTTITLRTDGVAEPSYDWAGWGQPQIVVWNASRPQPGEPHPW